jgi:hypothetical protein
MRSNANSSNAYVREFADGALRVWTEAGASLHIKSVTPSGDPVELNAEELRELILSLNGMLHEIQ